MAKIVLQGVDAFKHAIDKDLARLDRAAKVITTQSAAAIEAAAKRNFIGSHAKGLPHVGGNRPNVVTGMTRRSITADPVLRVGPYAWGTQVGPTVKWGRRLELGGTGPPTTTTRPFPYLGSAVHETEALRRQIAITQWGRALG